MPVYTVFSQNVSTQYKTTLCSKSTFFVIITTFVAFVFPLLLAYRSQGFWVKSLTYREQPLIKYKREYFVYMETEDEPIICTTVRKKTDYLEILDKCTSIKFYENDVNLDGKNDNILLDITVEDSKPLSIQSLYLVLAFDLILQQQCLLEMEALAVLQTSSPYPGRRVETQADLVVAQRALLPCRGRDLRYNQSAFSNPHLNIQQLVLDQALQNVSIRLDREIIHWFRGEDKTFTMHLHLSFPEVDIKYRPGFWPVMKWAWIQYFSILVIFLALLKSFKSYVFLNHLLPTVLVRSWKKLEEK